MGMAADLEWRVRRRLALALALAALVPGVALLALMTDTGEAWNVVGLHGAVEGPWPGVGWTLTALLGAHALAALLIWRRLLHPVLGDIRATAEGLEAAKDRLEHSALHDHLTGLPNRRYVEDHLERAIAAGARTGIPVAVLHIDLDDFKAINDRYGHATGDRALAALGRTMRAAIRRSDFLGRMGGDEFVVVATENRDPRGLETLAERLIERISIPFVANGHLCELNASIGIALSPPVEPKGEMLLQRADVALYAAKAGGQGSYRFHPDAQAVLDSTRRNVPLPSLEALARVPRRKAHQTNDEIG